jgi:putative transposase
MLENRVEDAQVTDSPSGALASSRSPLCKRNLSRDEMELRRIEAAEDFLHGLSQSQVVAKFGVSRTTASRWHCELTVNGLESLRKTKASGRPSRLTSDEKAQIASMFDRGPLALGFSDKRWTAPLLARVIEEHFSVHYSLEHVARLLTKLGPARTEVCASESTERED